jgi:hypothetical protein
MAKKLRRPGQLSAKATEMRNLALKASEATHGFGKISPFELAISWTNAENVLAPWGRGVKSSVTFYNNHAADFPIATGDLNSFIRDTAAKVKDQLGLDAVPDLHIGYGIEDDLMRSTGGGRVFGQYAYQPGKDSSYINIFPDMMWDRIKEDRGNINDLLKSVTETVSHEMRHMYQYEGSDNKKWKDKTEKYRKKHGMNSGDKYKNYRTYYNDPIEKDARRYEKKFRRRNIKDLKNDLQNRQSRLAEITQRKLKEQARLNPFKRGEGTWRIADDNFDYGPVEFDLNGLDIPNNSVDIQDSKNYRKLKKGEGTYRVVNAPPEEEWFPEYDGADNAPFGAEDFDDEFLANLTDDQILEQATTNEELERYIKMRNDARTKLGMDNQTFNTETENKTIKNNFNGVKQQQTTEETIDEKIKRLTEEERQRFEKESQADFDKRMKEIEAEFNQEEKRIEKEFGPRIEDTEKRLRKNKSPNRSRKEKLETAGKRLKNKKISKPNKSTRFKPKGDNLNEIIVNTMVSSVVNTSFEAAEETIEKATGEATKTIFENTKTQREKILEDPEGYIESFFNDYENRQHEGYNDKNRYLNKDGSSNINNYEFEANDNPQENFKYPEGYTGKETDFYVDSEGNTTINKTNKTKSGNFEANKKRESFNNRPIKGGDADIFDWMKNHKIGILDIGFNLFGAVGDYKNARREGHGVISSTARAAASFAIGEMMGFWGYMGFTVAKEVPKLAIKGVELLYKENRKMNSAANNQVFGGAQFYDTQQLATMRQSGMEMAKMAQYNLQQTLMGNEATHLHR